MKNENRGRILNSVLLYHAVKTLLQDVFELVDITRPAIFCVCERYSVQLSCGTWIVDYCENSTLGGGNYKPHRDDDDEQ